MSIARLGEAIENPSIAQIMAAYPSKKEFDAAAQQGKIKPTTEAGIVANIYNRIINEALAQKAQSELTVFQEATGSAPQMGLAAAQQMQGQPPAQGQGLDQIPVSDQMFNAPQGMAGGGIVAFQAGGPSFSSALAGEMPADPRYLRAFQTARGERMPRKELVDLMTLAELQEFNRSGAIPERLASQVQGRAIEGIPQFGGDMYSFTPEPPVVSPQEVAVETAKFARQAQTQTPGVPGGIPSALPEPAPAPTPKPKPIVKTELEAEAPKPRGFDSILQEIQSQMPAGQAYGTLESEVLKDREARAEERKQAGWMRLAEAGLGIMGGESPYAMVNIGKGAAGALKGYAEDLREQKKLDREDRKLLADIEQARRAESVGNIKLASERYENALNRLSQEDQNRIRVEAQLRVAMMQAGKPSEQVQLIERMMSDPKFREEAISFAKAQAEAKDPEKAAMASLINQALRGAGGANVGAQLSDLMKRYPDAFK